MDPANERNYHSTAVRCHACAEQATASKAWDDSAAADRAGLFFTVSRRQSR